MKLDYPMLEEFDRRSDWVEAPQALSSEYRHKNGTHVGSAIAAAAARDLPHHDRSADLALVSGVRLNAATQGQVKCSHLSAVAVYS